MNHVKTVLLLLTLLPLAAGAQGYSGTFSAQTEMGTFTLILRSVDGDTYEGELVGEGGMFSLNGAIVEGGLSGSAGDGYDTFGFQVTRDGDLWTFSLFEPDESGEPVEGTTETLVFSPIEGMSAASGDSVRRDVRINGILLGEEQLSEFESIYRQRPVPGDYWYDAKSGLYGVVGFPSYGYMMPDHSFGTVGRDVSHGTTAVFINGRELPASEYAIWSHMVGSWIQQGRYWLDHQGNAGYEGDPAILINLFVASRQNGYSGQGGSGDNFWSTRFSAGNSNADNTQGYVSVPGYGPVGYGF